MSMEMYTPYLIAFENTKYMKKKYTKNIPDIKRGVARKSTRKSFSKIMGVFRISSLNLKNLLFKKVSK